MKRHAKLLIPGLNSNGIGYSGKAIEMCGSDSLVYLDGRKTLYNQIQQVRNHIERLKPLGKGICGYRIFNGEFSLQDSQMRYKYVNEKMLTDLRDKK